MANEKNLIQNQGLSREEVQAINRKGGIKSAEVQKKKRTLRDIMINFSNGELKEKQLKKKMQELGFEDEEITNKTAVGIGLWKEAVKGNVNAYKEYMALIGEQIPSEINVNNNVKVNPFADMSTEDILKHIELLEGGNGNNNNEGTDN